MGCSRAASPTLRHHLGIMSHEVPCCLWCCAPDASVASGQPISHQSQTAVRLPGSTRSEIKYAKAARHGQNKLKRTSRKQDRTVTKAIISIISHWLKPWLRMRLQRWCAAPRPDAQEMATGKDNWNRGPFLSWLLRGKHFLNHRLFSSPLP